MDGSTFFFTVFTDVQQQRSLKSIWEYVRCMAHNTSDYQKLMIKRVKIRQAEIKLVLSLPIRDFYIKRILFERKTFCEEITIKRDQKCLHKNFLSLYTSGKTYQYWATNACRFRMYLVKKPNVRMQRKVNCGQRNIKNIYHVVAAYTLCHLMKNLFILLK